MLDDIRVSDIIINPPRVHPNGFIQIDISSLCRLHIWDDRIATHSKVFTPYHNHHFDVHSVVLKGTMINTVYDVVPVRDNDVRYDWREYFHKYDVVRLENNNSTLQKNDDTEYYIEPRDLQFITEGKEYYLDKEIIHDSGFEGTTVTLMFKDDIDFSFTPVVLVPVDKVPDELCDRNVYDPELVDQVIKEATDDLFITNDYVSFLLKFH